MKICHMKMSVVIEIFFRSHNSGNCVLDHITLYSDECLVLVPADDSGKVSSPFLILLSRIQHQANRSGAQRLLSSRWPGWFCSGIRAAPPQAELVHVIHPVTPGFDGLGSPCSAVGARSEQALRTSLAHFSCVTFPVAGLLYGPAAASLHLPGEQPLPAPRDIFFWWYR